MSSQALSAVGDAAFNKSAKVNGDLFVLTYGAIVMQLLRDLEDPKLVNTQLDTMGYNIGIRIVDEFLVRSGVKRCGSFQDSVEVTAKAGFKMFIGVSPVVGEWNSDKTACSYIFGKENLNPLEDHVELPEELRGTLNYSNILAGVIRGALESISYKVKVYFVRDSLRGDEATEIRIELVEVIQESAGDEYKEE